MKIGLIAPPWLPVPPPSYGGTESVVDGLARGLAARGHDVRLFTVGESTCPVTRFSLFGHAVDAMGTTLPEVAHVVAAWEALADCDVIHDHTVAGPLMWAHATPFVPVATTNHGVFNEAARTFYSAVADHVAIVAISHHQRSTAGDVPVRAVIHHGIDLVTQHYGPGGGGYLFFIGRMSPDKGIHRAIRIARRAGRRLVIVSKMWEPEEIAYFEQRVRPMLGRDVELLTETTLDERIELMRHAEALVNPISWDEPFGLVMAEALGCGTPVLGFPRGAAPEIVDHGVTGYLSDDEAALAAVDIASFDRRACRAAAEEKFSLERMALDHERFYRHLVSSHRAHLVPA